MKRMIEQGASATSTRVDPTTIQLEAARPRSFLFLPSRTPSDPSQFEPSHPVLVVHPSHSYPSLPPSRMHSAGECSICKKPHQWAVSSSISSTFVVHLRLVVLSSAFVSSEHASLCMPLAVSVRTMLVMSRPSHAVVGVLTPCHPLSAPQ